MKWNDLRVSFRLSVCITGLMVAMLGVAAVTQLMTVHSAEQGQNLVSDYDERIVTAVRWLGTAEITSERIVAVLGTSDGDLVLQYEEEIKLGHKRMEALKNQILLRNLSADDRRYLAEIQSSNVKLETQIHATTVLSQKGDIVGLQNAIQNDVRPAIRAYLAALQKFVALEETQRDAVLSNVEKQRRWLLGAGATGGMVLLVVGIMTAFFIARSITLPLAHAVRKAEEISQGRLYAIGSPATPLRKDEFGQLQEALDRMSRSLCALVSQVRNGVDSVSVATSKIAVSNQELAERTERAVGDLQITAAAMEEFTGTISESAGTAKEASRLVIQAAQSATRGRTVMKDVIARMDEISTSSRKIGEITGVIDSMAFQTNLLALNAAVEVARAGEQGRGFAVVAGEVRNLAHRSAQAAREIKALITASLDAVGSGSVQVDQAGSAMSEIVEDVNRVSELIGLIAEASVEQLSGINQVNEALTNIDSSTQRNAALVNEASQVATSVNSDALHLEQLVSVFQIENTVATVRNLT